MKKVRFLLLTSLTYLFFAAACSAEEPHESFRYGENMACPLGFVGQNCDECAEGFWGQNCDKIKVSCINGTPKLGKKGDGTCFSCKEGTAWSGVNCDICKDTAGYGENCTPYGELKDKDNHTYKTATIKTIVKKSASNKDSGHKELIWMAQNYNLDLPGAKSVDNNPENDAIFGKLYSWNMAKAANFCPAGWRLPTKKEYESLLAASGDNGNKTTNPAFLALIAKSDLWYAPEWETIIDTNSDYLTTDYRGKGGLGFMALPAGFCVDNDFGCAADGNYTGLYAYFWSATNENGEDEANIELADTTTDAQSDSDNSDGSSENISNQEIKAYVLHLGLGFVTVAPVESAGFASVRCVKNAN